MDAKDDRFQTIAGQTVIDRKLNAAMHSSIGAWAEAQAIYIGRSQLAERARSGGGQQTLCVLDVGLGIGANALALIEAWSSTNTDHRTDAWLELTSVESETGGLRSALAHPGSFAFMERNRSLLESLLLRSTLNDTWIESPAHRVRWRLVASRLEDALPTLHTQSFDLIYYDLYGPAEQPTAWGLRCLGPTAQLLKPTTGVWLSYASATRVRSALLLAGLEVFAAPATRIKKEMTLAATPSLAPKLLPSDAGALDKRFLDHLQRSTRPWPDDLLPENIAASWLQLENALRSR